GTGYPIMLATNAANGGSRQRRVGEGHLGPTQDSVNALFARILRRGIKPSEFRGFYNPATAPQPAP
ncbi:hypothetical protein, partial [Qipengyuania flava]|uniref:hypothetical protein n=1 Tax=Qipengyuania flava TaxID=192812 RepID=UPI001C56ECAB